MKQHLISVVLCFLNPGAWLAEAIESVIAQTYPNWELILVDDGSCSADTQTARSYADRYPSRIRYTDHDQHVNIGLTASRNQGIALAKGDYIAFLDADDEWYENKLADQLQILDRWPAAAMVCEASRFWYSWEDEQCNDPITYIGAPEGLYWPGELTRLLYPLGPGQPPCPTGIMIRKKALLRHGGFEEKFQGIYQLYEDQAFLAKLYLNEAVYISGHCNNKYRKHGGSMSGAAGDAELYSQVRNFFLDWLSTYAIKNHLTDIALEELISKSRLPLPAQGPE